MKWVRYKLFSLALAILYAFPSFAWEKSGEDVLEEIVVTATRTEKELESSPASTAVVTHRDINIRDVRTIDQAVNDIPGVMVRRGKGLMDTLSSITLRGIPEQKRTLILVMV